MKYITIDKVDVGINRQLPSNKVTWADGRNVRFRKGLVEKMPGKSPLVYVSSPIHGIYTYYDPVAFKVHTLFCGGNIYQTDETMNINKNTPAIYSSPYASPISFMMLGNLPLVNHAFKGLAKITGTTASAVTEAPLFATGVVHNNRILAAKLSIDGTVWRSRIAWSGDKNPTQWFYNNSGDNTLAIRGKAGYVDLIDPQTGYDTSEAIKRIITVGGIPFIFTSKLLWTLDSVRHPVIYKKKIVHRNVELVTPTAIALSASTEDDVVYFMDRKGFFALAADGSLSELSWDLRDYALSILNWNALTSIFAFKKQATKEAWFCVPTGTSMVADTAFIYNYEEKTWTIADCDFTAFGATSAGVEICANSQGQIFKMDDGFDNNGYPINGYLESGDMPFDDEMINKYLHEVWPQVVNMARDNMVYIHVGTKERLLDTVTWSVPYEYKIGTSMRANFRRKGKWLRVRVGTWQKNSPWAITGLKIGYENGGLR